MQEHRIRFHIDPKTGHLLMFGVESIINRAGRSLLSKRLSWDGTCYRLKALPGEQLITRFTTHDRHGSSCLEVEDTNFATIESEHGKLDLELREARDPRGDQTVIVGLSGLDLWVSQLKGSIIVQAPPELFDNSFQMMKSRLQNRPDGYELTPLDGDICNATLVQADLLLNAILGHIGPYALYLNTVSWQIEARIGGVGRTPPPPADYGDHRHRASSDRRHTPSHEPAVPAAQEPLIN